MLHAIKADPVASRIAWLLVWRNDRLDHHYAPYPNHSSAANFVDFSKDPVMVFQSELTNVYKLD